MLHRIIEQVDDGLLHGLGIYDGIASLFILVCRTIEQNFHTPFDGGGGDGLDGLADDASEIASFEFIGLAALFNARKIEDVFNENSQATAFLHEKIEIFLLFFGI